MRTGVAFALLLAAFGVLSYESRWFNDDAFITFRYARNLAEGHGLVWNVDGAPVEGSTSLGWTLLSAAAIRLDQSPLGVAHFVGAVSGAAAMLLCWRMGHGLLGLSPWWALLAPALLCMQRQWVVLGVSGMETRAATLLLLAATASFLLEQSRPRARGFTSGALFLVATTFRPEAPLLHLAAGVAAVGLRRDVATLRTTLESGAVHIAGLAVLTLWRMSTFGQPLPNTFYAKVGALQLERGLPYVGEFLLQTHVWLWGPVLLLSLRSLWKRSAMTMAVLAAQLFVWLAWVAAFGGGRWEFRLLDPLLPLLAVWIGASVAALVSLPWLSERARPALAVSVAAGLLLLNGLSSAQPFQSFGHVISANQAHAAAQLVRAEGRTLSRFLRPADRIATGWAGTLPYETRAHHFDPWGLNDPGIARREFDPTGLVFHQRHATWRDMQREKVMFVDVFNHFLHAAAYDPRVRRSPSPWVEAGAPIYSVKLDDGRFWVFASAVSRSEVETRLRSDGLEVHSMQPLAAADLRR